MKAKMNLFFVAVLGLLALCSSAWAVEVNEPASHWKFDEGSGTIAYDCVGDNNGIIYGAQWTIGQLDGALSFDGVNDYVDCGTGPAITGTGTFAVSAWVKTDSPAGAIVVQRTPTSADGSYGLSIVNNGKAMFYVYNGGLGFIFQSDVIVNDGLWHHIVVVRTNSTDGEIYIDGSLAGSGSGSARSLNNVLVNIGRGTAGTSYFNGSIDDVRIYDTALSAEEIWQLYLDGLSEYERAVICVENAIDKKQVALEAVDAALVEEADAYEALEELLETRDYGDLKKNDIVKARQGIRSAMQHQEQSAGALAKSIERLYDVLTALGWEPEPEPNEPGLIAHWKFDETSGTIALDCVGDNNGTVYGAEWTTGQIDGALSFDGIDDHVDCGTGPAITGTGTFTTSVWVMMPEGSGGAIVVQRSITSADGSYGLSIVNNGKAMFYVYNGGLGFIFQSDVIVNDGLWHHIVVVRTNSTDGEIYIDGSLAGSGSGPARSLNNVPVWIGRAFTTPDYFNGSIDDVRIYDKALIAEEVQQLYQDGL